MKPHFLALVTFILFLSTQIGVPSLPRLSAEMDDIGLIQRDD